MTNENKNDPLLNPNYFWELYQRWDDAGRNTIWGVSQSVHDIPKYGIITVSTASHGGVMIHQAYARRLLTPRGYAFGVSSREKGCKGWLFYEEDIDECIVLSELLERGEPEYSICDAFRFDYHGVGELRSSLETSLASAAQTEERLNMFPRFAPYIEYMEARRKRLQNKRRNALEKDVYCMFSERKCITTGETEEKLMLGVYETADQAIAAIEYEAALQKKEMGYSVKLDISSSRDIDYRVIVSHTNSISGLCYEDMLWYEQTTYFSAEAPLGKYC